VASWPDRRRGHRRTPHAPRPRSRIDLRRILPAAWLLLTLAACAQSLEHRWRDPRFGFEVQSGFPRIFVEGLVASKLEAQLLVLGRVFGVDDVSGLRVFVYDEDPPALGDARVGGFHRSGELHLFARFLGSRIGIPHPTTEHTLGHELVHALVAMAGLELPTWMEEGLAEVLASSAPDGQGVLLWYDMQRERQARSLLAAGRALDAAALLALRDEYPQGEALPAMYAQAASFVAFLMQVGDIAPIAPAEVRARLDRMLAATPAELTARFTAWERELASTGANAQLLRMATAGTGPARRLCASSMHGQPRDQDWWAVAERLLADDDVAVRTSTRITVAFNPESRDHDRFVGWRDAGARPLRMAALAALAQLGDADAALALLEEIGGPADVEWVQPLLWVLMRSDAPERSAWQAELLRCHGAPELLLPWSRQVAETLRARR